MTIYHLLDRWDAWWETHGWIDLWPLPQLWSWLINPDYDTEKAWIMAALTVFLIGKLVGRGVEFDDKLLWRFLRRGIDFVLILGGMMILLILAICEWIGIQVQRPFKR